MRREAAPRIALTVAGAAAPALLTLVLMATVLNSSVSHFVPNIWNDQVDYWHRVASFAKVGFDTGYYSPNELPRSLVSGIRFGVNGPWYPMLYGPVASLVGWQTWTSIVVNMVLVSVAFVVYVAVLRPGPARVLAAAAVVLSTWPVLFYMPTTSQETLHEAFAIVLAAIFVRAIAEGSALRRGAKVAAVAVLVIFSIFRFSWAPLLPLLLIFLSRRPSSRRTILVALAAGLALSIASVEITGALQPPGRNSVITQLNDISHHPVSGTRAFLSSGFTNLKALLRLRTLPGEVIGYGHGHWVSLSGAQGWELCVLALVALIGLGATVLARRSARAGRIAGALSAREWVFHSVNLGLLILLAILLYLPAGYYRVLGAHLLLSSLVFAGLGRMRVTVALVAFNLLLVPVFLAAYRGWTPNFELNTKALATQRAALARLMPYQANAPSPWCNTVLVTQQEYDWRMTLITPGFGISYADPLRYPARIKSRYVLAPSDQADAMAPHVQANHLRPIAQTGAGRLYVNPNRRCTTR